MKLSPKRKSEKNIRKSSLKNNRSFKQMIGGDGSDDFKIPDKPTEDFDNYLNKCKLLIDIINHIEK